MTTDLIAQAEAAATALAMLPKQRRLANILADLIARIRELEGELERSAQGYREDLDAIADVSVERLRRAEAAEAKLADGAQPDHANLVAQLTRRADEMEAIDHSCSLQPAWVLEAITALEKAVKDNRRAAAALTASEAARKRAERELDDLIHDNGRLKENETHELNRAEAAEAKLAEVKKERDEARKIADHDKALWLAAEATVATLTAQVERYRYVLEGVRGAIDTGRSEPLFIWRDQINIALDDAALTTENQTNG